MARILVADDDDLLREFLRVRLAVCGHIVVEAADGMVALNLIVAEKFDLILMDDVMPGLSGWEILTEARKLPRFETTTVMMSQVAPSHIFTKSDILAGDQLLQKPFCPDELTALIETLCNTPNAEVRTGQKLRSMLVSAVLAAATISTAAQAQPSETNTQIASPLSLDKTTRGALALGVVHQQSWISNGAQADWQDIEINAEYSPQKDALYTAEVSRSSRFAQTDHLVALRGDWRIARNASVYVGAATSPKGNFREKWGLRAGGGVGLGNGIELTADSRISHYTTGTRFSLNPQLGVTFAEERIAVTAGWINLWESGGKHYQGWSARLRVKPNDQVELFAGLARYPEVETGTTLKVQSAYCGISVKFSSKLGASASYAWDRYQTHFPARH